MQFGVNTWVWTSPLSDAELAVLVPKVVEFGFDWIELPIETPDEFDCTCTQYHLMQVLFRPAG